MSATSVAQEAVVVGVDGSPQAGLALDWAVQDAHRRGLPLHVVHAFTFAYPATLEGALQLGNLEVMAEKVCRSAVDRAQALQPDLTITSATPSETAVPALLEAGEQADTLVVGARGLSHTKGLLMGSVSAQTAAHAQCPVVVVRASRASAADPSSAPAGGVVVGVDGSPSASRAVDYAFGQASAQGVGLTAVHGWQAGYVDGASADAMWEMDWRAAGADEDAMVADSVAAGQARFPDVEVQLVSVRGKPARTLVDASTDASLVVVGSRGRGELRGLLLGSVSQAVMHRAHCPVAIVRAPRDPATEPDDRAG